MNCDGYNPDYNEHYLKCNKAYQTEMIEPFYLAFVRAGRLNLNFSSYFHPKQWFRAHEMLFPHLRKALLIRYNNMATLNILQFLRFAASLMMLLFHLNFVRSGYKGVDVFFVISGFVMYYSLFYKPRPKAFNFVINRLSKIFFLYWVALILLYLIRPFKLESSFFSSFLLIPGHYSVLGVSWSLSYELYFYFLIGAVAYLVPYKYHKQIFYLLFLISTSITFINLTSFTLKGSFINFLFGGNFWEFLLGIAGSYLCVTYHKTIRPTTAKSIALFSCLLIIIIAIPYANPVSFLVYGPMSFLLVTFFAVYEKNRAVDDRLSKLFKILGDASYAIYLFGPIVTILISANNNLSKIIIIIFTICFSILFNQLIENNFLIWVKSIKSQSCQ